MVVDSIDDLLPPSHRLRFAHPAGWKPIDPKSARQLPPWLDGFAYAPGLDRWGDLEGTWVVFFQDLAAFRHRARLRDEIRAEMELWLAHERCRKYAKELLTLPKGRKKVEKWRVEAILLLSGAATMLRSFALANLRTGDEERRNGAEAFSVLVAETLGRLDGIVSVSADANAAKGRRTAVAARRVEDALTQMPDASRKKVADMAIVSERYVGRVKSALRKKRPE